MKTLLNLAVLVGFAGLLGACAAADDADAELEFADVEVQEEAAESEPEPTSEREIAPARDWGSCREPALRGVDCGQTEVVTEDDAPAAAALENEVQPSPGERWQASWQSR